jgi:hypothetical protein
MTAQSGLVEDASFGDLDRSSRSFRVILDERELYSAIGVGSPAGPVSGLGKHKIKSTIK